MLLRLRLTWLIVVIILLVHRVNGQAFQLAQCKFIAFIILVDVQDHRFITKKTVGK